MFQSRHLLALGFWLRPLYVFSGLEKRRLRGEGGLLRSVQSLWRRLRSNNLTPAVLALSIAVGLAVGLLPLYGLHGVMVAILCLPLRLDTVLAFAATMISNPFTFPFLTWLEVQIGCAILGGTCPSLDALLQGQGVIDVGYQLAIGASVTAVLVGVMGALVVWVGAHWVRAKEQSR